VSGHARNVLTPVLWVPLVFRLPFAVRSLRVETQVRNVDIAPTLLELRARRSPRASRASLFCRSRSLHLEMGGRIQTPRTSFAELGTPLYLDARIQASVTAGEWICARNVPPDPDASELLFSRRDRRL